MALECEWDSADSLFKKIVISSSDTHAVVNGGCVLWMARNFRPLGFWILLKFIAFNLFELLLTVFKNPGLVNK